MRGSRQSSLDLDPTIAAAIVFTASHLAFGAIPSFLSLHHTLRLCLLLLLHDTLMLLLLIYTCCCCCFLTPAAAAAAAAAEPISWPAAAGVCAGGV
jgi:hypothetical protein